MKVFPVFVFFAIIAPLYVTLAGVCTPLIPDKAVAGYNPVFNSNTTDTYYSNNTLVVSIGGPYVKTRTYINATVEGLTSPKCVLGSTGSFWAVTSGNFTTDCRDRVVLTLPWVNHGVCGFNNITSDDVTLNFKGKIVLTYQEQAGNFSGSPVFRTAVHNYVVFISFPKTLTVDLLNINVNSIIPVDVALTSEKYDADLGVLNVEFTTGVVWSSMLSSAATLSTPSNIASTPVVVDNSQCTLVAGSVCMQKITFKLSVADNSTCVFNGDYVLNGTLVACRENSGAGCSTSEIIVSFTLDSGNLCPSVGLRPVLTGSLTSYTGSDFLTASQSYNLGDRVFFLVSTNAGTGNTVAIRFLNITFEDSQSVQPLLLNQASTAIGDSSTITVNNAANYFSLYLSGAVFKNTIGSSQSYKFTALCQVTFTGNKKRTMEFEWDSAEKVLSSTRIELAGPEEEDIEYIEMDKEGTEVEVDNAISFAANAAGAVLGVAVTVMVVAVYKKLTRRV